MRIIKPGKSILGWLWMLTALATVSASRAEVITSDALTFEIETITNQLGIPWGIDFLPTGELLVTEREGHLRIIRDGQLQKQPIAGVPKVRARGQGGLLDIALHPDYAENGWLYLAYSSPSSLAEKGVGSNTALMRARLQGNTLVDQQVLFKALPNYRARQHFGGRIAFDRDNFVYLSMGDRGARDKVQSLDNPRGKIFRLHDDGRVPQDNPFVSEPGAVAATWSWGHRNPQGMTLHPQTGELWAHEHGPQGGDELNLILRGANYGWPTITYGVNYGGGKITDETKRDGMQQPVTYWVPSIAPSGMVFVDHPRYGKWNGNLLVGSLSFRYLNRAVMDGHRVVREEKLLSGIGRVRDVVQSPDGYIYLAVENPGRILKILPP